MRIIGRLEKIKHPLIKRGLGGDAIFVHNLLWLQISVVDKAPQGFGVVLKPLWETGIRGFRFCLIIKLDKLF